MDQREYARTTPHALLMDKVRVVSASLLFMLLAIVRRLLGLRRRPAWSFRLEVIIAAYRGSWSVVPEISIVRWRNVGEAMSPLRTDGLTPQFTRLGSGSRSIVGVWLEPPDANGPVVLYLHGGGFSFASLRTHGTLIGALARAARARTIAFDYRLSPENPAPAALEDAHVGGAEVLHDQVVPLRAARRTSRGRRSPRGLPGHGARLAHDARRDGRGATRDQ